jgi:hypothetical protein
LLDGLECPNQFTIATSHIEFRVTLGLEPIHVVNKAAMEAHRCPAGKAIPVAGGENRGGIRTTYVTANRRCLRQSGQVLNNWRASLAAASQLCRVDVKKRWHIGKRQFLFAGSGQLPA